MENEYFVFNEEAIDVYHDFLHYPNGKLSFHIDHVGILVPMECGKTRNDFSW